MRIGGFQKFSLIDYPGKVAAVVFTQGCDFRCPFCHNPALVLPERFGKTISKEEVLSYLNKRKDMIDAVVISGGEPSCQKDIIPFMKEIRSMGYLLKLDTNGYSPGFLSEVIHEDILDFIAMDIKSSPSGYAMACGQDIDIEHIHQSIDLIIESLIPHEFRTTVVPTIHREEHLSEIRAWMKDLKAHHIFQEFRPGDNLDPNFNIV